MKTKSKYHKTKTEILAEQDEIRAAQKDPAKFEILYNKYYEAVFRFVYQRLDSMETAADITAQVFVKALSNIKKYKSKGVPFSAWLFRIASNELIDLFKTNNSLRTINLETSHIENLVDEIEQESLDDLYTILINAIKQLPEDDLQILEMRYFENRAFKEIGNILSITENNAKVRVYRIIDTLKKQLSKH